ncbi:hypothetical protein D5086_003106 [Populus alba]|uniref:Uncharacterized protein n=1 Tax=Populus alba TaxID=43335 RepID=A0ACC4D3K0_POPAL
MRVQCWKPKEGNANHLDRGIDTGGRLRNIEQLLQKPYCQEAAAAAVLWLALSERVGASFTTRKLGAYVLFATTDAFSENYGAAFG